MKATTVIGAILITLLVGTQVLWFSKTYDSQVDQFEHSISVALYAVADTMSDQAIVEKRSPNYFYVKMGCPASSQLIDTLIRKEFSMRNLQLDYELGIYNAEDDTLVHGKYVAASDIDSETHLTEKEMELCNKDFAVLFPDQGKFVLSQMDTWLYSSLVFLILSSVLFHSLGHKVFGNKSYSKKQLIRLGHSQLDRHNQYLIVHGKIFQLTYKENKILQLLFQHPNQVIERQIFLQEVWEKDGFFVERSMDVFISRIRKYLKADSSLKIENLRSIGYRLHVK